MSDQNNISYEDVRRYMRDCRDGVFEGTLCIKGHAVPDAGIEFRRQIYLGGEMLGRLRYEKEQGIMEIYAPAQNQEIPRRADNKYGHKQHSLVGTSTKFSWSKPKEEEPRKLRVAIINPQEINTRYVEHEDALVVIQSLDGYYQHIIDTEKGCIDRATSAIATSIELLRETVRHKEWFEKTVPDLDPDPQAPAR